MSKVVKGIVGAVKGIVKGIVKAFKSVVKSPFGKILMMAAAVYLGGAAFGLWESPFSSINGVLAGEAGSQSAGAAIVQGAGPEAVTATAAPEAIGAAGQEVAAGTASPAAAEVGSEAVTSPLLDTGSVTGSPLGQGSLTAPVEAPSPISPSQGLINNAGATTSPAAESLVSGGTSAAPDASWASNLTDAAGGSLAAPDAAGSAYSGLASKAGSSGSWLTDTLQKVWKGAQAVGSYAEKNPMATFMVGNALSNMGKPNEIDIAQERERLRREDIARVQPNFMVGNVRTPPPSGRALRDANGNLVYDPTVAGPQGLIQRNM